MRTSITLVACGLAVPSLAAAQDLVGRFELTPFAAFRVGGELDEEGGNRNFTLGEHAAQGLIFNIRASARNGQWELSFARQDTSIETQDGFAGGRRLGLDVDYLQFGGTYLFEGVSARPFVAASAGATHFEPALPGFGTETYLSGSLGGGLQLRADKRLGVRLEGRVFGTFLDHDGELFCPSSRTSDPCALAIDGTLLIQWEARAGIVFRF